MSRLKTYTLGINGMPRREVIEALGLPNWIRQVQIIAAERTKTAAHALLESRRLFVSPRDSEFRVDDSRIPGVLGAAGLCDEPNVYALPMDVGDLVPVVRVLVGGTPEFVGVLRRIDGALVFSREQMPEVSA